MYFVALVCSQEVNEKILPFKLWMKERFGCVVALRSPAHITLIPPFWLEAEKENELVRTLQSFTNVPMGVVVCINGFSHFGKRVLFAAVDDDPALHQLKTGIESHFTKRFPGIRKDDRPFHPHITIANRDLKPGDFIKAWQYFSEKEFTADFRINVVSVLKHSDGLWKVFAENG
jgi:2'-5' RNA ligase